MPSCRFEILHNIPAPYRVHLFNCIAEVLEERGFSFHVHFFGDNNPDRPESWRRALKDARFSYKIWGGYAISIGGATYWLNPGLICYMLRHPPEILMHGGIWDSVTSALTLLLSRPSIRVGWLEFNIDIPGMRGGVARWVKRTLLKRCQCLLVPGEKGMLFLQRYLGDDLRQRAILLPNIVDESRFGFKGDDGHLKEVKKLLGVDRVSWDTLVLIWPARLIKAKGILEFISKLDEATVAGYVIRIIGDGPLRANIAAEITRRGLSQHVALVDRYIDYELMPAVYRAGDALLLPSLQDPNPLSVVEALQAGLPLLLSDRVGNFTEAMIPGVNGFGFDPNDGAAVRDSLKRFRALSREERAKMGSRSSRIAETVWGSRACVDRAVAGILGSKPLTATSSQVRNNK